MDNTSMPDGKIQISVVIPVKNEEKNLRQCLERLERFEEVFVVDSGSTDGTKNIAESFGARWVDFDWNGRYPKKRNWFLTTQSINTDWVLFLDADEYVDDSFCDEVEVATRQADFDGYWLEYENYFLGKKLKHGLEQRKLALFKKDVALYEYIEEDRWSKFDMEIHEHPLLDGDVGYIDCRIEHNDYKGLSHFIGKHNEYAQWEAMRIEILTHNPRSFEGLTSRQRFKYKNICKWWYPWFYFVFTFVLKRGFVDGSSGFNYAFYKAWYFHTIRLMIKENTAISPMK